MTAFRMTRSFVIAISLMACATTPPASPTAPASTDTVRGLADLYWDLQMARYPEWATNLGDHRHDDRLTDLSDEARAAYVGALRELSARLAATDNGEPSDQDALTGTLLALSLRDDIDGELLGQHTWRVDQLSGPQVDFPQLVQFHPTGTAEDCARLVARYRAFPAQLAQHIANLRAGLASGKVAARINVERVAGQLRDLLAYAPGEGPLEGTASRCASHADALVDAARREIRPALTALLALLTDELLPRARDQVGIWAVPGGREAYLTLIAMHTTQPHEPDDLHALGLGEVTRIRVRMDELAARMRKPERPAELAAELMQRPDQRALTREALVERNRAALRRADAALPSLFGKLPKTPYELRPLEAFREKDAPAAYYYPAPQDGSRPGIYYVNTYRPETRPLANLEALAFHEAVPGHHLQIALAAELGELPAFRRHGGTTAYVEGWALYAEGLAEEAGLYSDDVTLFGRLGYEAWRAARLVVDTGLHAKHWTREQAIDYLLGNTSLPRSEVENEVDRYIVWPGQALAYKVGELEIRALRDLAKRNLGERFDLRAFHDHLLGAGALPLPVLRARMEAWIAAQPGG